MGLILGIIGILVIAAGLGAGIYYGGDSYTESILKGDATKNISQAEQITTMISIYKANERVSPPDLDTVLLDKYYNRSQDRMGWIYDTDTSRVHKVMESVQHCEAINKDLGYEGESPTCDAIPSELSDKKYYCCTN